MSRKRELEARRVALVARSALQRGDASAALGGVEHALWPLDAVAGLVRRSAGHPVLATGVIVAVLLAVRPLRALRMLVWGLSAATAVRRIASLRRITVQ